MLNIRLIPLVAVTIFSSTLLGCSGALIATPVQNAIVLTGNWQISSSVNSAVPLASLSGELTGSGASITGILHANAKSGCMASSAAIPVSGAMSPAGVLTLTGSNVAGGTLTITGTPAADGKSLSAASYMVAGGSCAFAAPAAAQAASYASVTGTYAGSFGDGSGQILSLSADLMQSPQSNTTGDFLLSGSATLPNNPCFNSPAAVSNSQVSGGSFNLTYSDAATGNSVNALGTFTTDGKTLNVTQWILSGPCGPDSGTGTLTKQ